MKKIVALTLVCLMSLTLVACAAPAAAPAATSEAAPAAAAPEATAPAATAEKPTVALVQVNLTHTFHLGIEQGMKRAAKDFDFTLISTSGDDDVTTQLNVFNDLVEQGVDVIAINPINIDAFDNAYREATEKGVKIVSLFNDTEYMSAQFKFNEYEMSHEIGDYAAELLTQRYGETKGKVAVISGILGQDINDGRTQGFLDSVAQHEGIEVMAVEAGNFDGTKAVTIAENYLTAYPDLDLIYSCSDDMAIPVGGVIADNGKADQIMICSIEGSDAGTQAILDGVIDSSYLQCSQACGYTIGKLADQVIKNGTGDLVNWTGINVTRENVEDLRAFNNMIANNIDEVVFPEGEISVEILFNEYLKNK